MTLVFWGFFHLQLLFLGSAHPPVILPFLNVNPRTHTLLIRSGNPFLLECNVIGESNITWSRNGSLFPPPDIPGLREVGHILEFYEPRPLTHSGDYQCVAESPMGKAFSVIARLRDFDHYKQHENKYSPRISVGPESVEGALGAPMEMTCSVGSSSRETVFTWTRNGEILAKGTQNPSVFRIEALRSSDMGSIACNASNPWGYDLRGAYLSIRPEGPLLDLRPDESSTYYPENYNSSLYLEVGGRLSCFLLGGHPPPTLSWSRNGLPVPFNGSDESQGSTLFIQQDGLYSCEALNAHGREVRSLNVSLLDSPLILEGPVNASGSLGERVLFNCSVLWLQENKIKMEIYWKKNEEDGFWNEDSSWGGRVERRENGRLLEIHDLRLSDAGKYTCIVFSSMGLSRASAYLEVSISPPRIREGPMDITRSSGSSLRLPCTLDTPQKTKVIWSSSSHVNLLSLDRTVLHSDGSLSLEDLRVEDSGIYTCRRLIDDLFSVEASGFLNVRPRTRMRWGPHHVVFEAGSTVYMDCVLEVDEFLRGSLNSTWIKDGDVPLRTEDRWEILENGTLVLRDLSEDDIGIYTCSATTSVDAVSASGRIYRPVRIDWLLVSLTFALMGLILLMIFLTFLTRCFLGPKGGTPSALASLAGEELWLERGMR